MPERKMVDHKVTVIMTRPKGSNQRFLDLLSLDLRDRVRVLCSPLIDIQAVPGEASVSQDEAVIFTSAHAVRYAPDGVGRSAFCVGQATTRAAHDKGWSAECGGENADALIAYFARTVPVLPLVHLSGVHVRGDIVGALSRLGLTVRRAVIYDQCLCSLSSAAIDALCNETRVIVPLFSPRAASHFSSECPKPQAVQALCLSQAVSDALGEMPVYEQTISPSPDAQAMAEALEKIIVRASLA